MKRRSETDLEPLQELFQDERLKVFLLTHFSVAELEERMRSGLQLHELPVDYLASLVDQHLDMFLAMFAINKEMNAIQAKPGFWSGLFKARFPAKALKLALFISESPEWHQFEPSDLKALRQLTKSLNKDDADDEENNETPSLFDTSTLLSTPLPWIEEMLMSIGLDALDRYYETADMDPRAIHLLPLILRKYLMKLHYLVNEAQLGLNASLYWLNDKFGGTEDLVGVMTTAMDFWQNHMAKERRPVRLNRYMEALRQLKEAFLQEVASIQDNPNNTVPSWYLLPLEARFEAYFGLNQEEATRLWKKYYTTMRISERERLAVYPIFEWKGTDCHFCRGKENLLMDNKLSIPFCNKTCQQSFYNHFYLPTTQLLS